jgi:exo-beta-1,3-glucanase (GH17 family)
MPLAGIDASAMSDHDLANKVRDLLANKIHGIAFSPYTEGQTPATLITEQQIKQRLAVIQNSVRWIRSFSCTNGNENIPKIAKQQGLNTLVGVWLDDNLENNEKELANAIELAKAGYVDMLAIGNEVLLREELTQAQLIDYINRAKQTLPHIEIGYVDAYYLFEDYPEVTACCDVIFANCYPFWEGCPAEYALLYMKDMYHRAVKVANGKKVIISETGWPNVGSADRGAIPSQFNAMIYFINTYIWSQAEHIDVFYFSSFDETWKVADEGDVGAYWGLWDQHGQLKYC